MNAAGCEGEKKGGGGQQGLRGEEVMGLKCETPLRREEERRLRFAVWDLTLKHLKSSASLTKF